MAPAQGPNRALSFEGEGRPGDRRRAPSAAFHLSGHRFVGDHSLKTAGKL
jgi:hypothetical protein